MIKILHTGDVHLGDLNGPVKDGKNARREDTIRCMRAIAETAESERPNVSIIAGDLFNRSRVWADTALDDIDTAVATLIRPLCRHSDRVVLLFGTANHDNPKAFNALRILTQGLHNLSIYTVPEIDTLNTSGGEIQILAMPGFDKGRLRVFMPDEDAESENKNATTLVNEIVIGQAAQLDHTKPSVLVAHYTIAGCETESGQTFLAGQDVVVLPQTIDAAGVTLACFGHIHKPQRISCNTPTFYSGSPNQLTFNDEGERHGFYIHEIADDGSVESRFINTPERLHYTLRMTRDEVAAFITTGTLDTAHPEIKDAIVRVYLDATLEQDKQLNRAALQRHLMDKDGHGAFHVADFILQDTGEFLATDGTAAEDTPEQALHRYLGMTKDGGAELSETDIQRMEELAAPIIRAADDGREADQHTGAFLPKRIEVTNYRSYTHAEFTYEDIRMAMVNGPNGVGKSSLFMDAMADALYEQSRDGSVGEWVRAGESKGAIIFEFEMGGYDWRVSRTRKGKDKKPTLALARKDRETGEWVNESDTTTVLTQKKIIQTVGMDYQTFCSIALIRQDAYGIFLETDSDRRMEVLSALLNLGIYTRAEELAKGKAKEQRARLASLNDRMSVLDEQMAAKEAIETELKEKETGQELRAAQAKALEGEIGAAEREETLRQELIRQAYEKAKEAANLDAQAAEKEAELKKQEAERDSEQVMAALAGKAKEAAETVDQARKELETLADDEARLKSLSEKKDRLTSEVDRGRTSLTQIDTQIATETVTLENRAQIEAAVAEIEAVRKAREELAPRAAEFDKATKQLDDLRKQRSDFLAESKVRITDLKNKVEQAQQKKAMLAVSGCPNPETATCEFLKDAKAAEKELATTEPQLAQMKETDKAAYEELNAKIEDAKAKLVGMGDPKAESAALDERERKAAPLAGHAGKLQAAQATIEQLEKQKEEKTTAIQEAEKELEKVKAEIEPLKQSAEKAKQLRERIKEAEPTAQLQAKCAAAEATVKALTVTIELITIDAEKARCEANVARQEATQMRERVPESTANLERLREKKDALAKETETAAKEIGGLQSKLDGIREAKEQWEAYRDEKKIAARTLNDYQTLAGAFGIDGIQYLIIRSIVPEIQARANSILAAMTGGKMAADFRTERQNTTGKIVNSLDVWINSLTGGGRPYSSHSGGEKVKIALAVTLGLADVKAHRAGVQLGMLFIDEPPFLDQDGTDAYADALVTMANRNPDMRILAISHDPAMKARFSQNIVVSAGENGSEVWME